MFDKILKSAAERGIAGTLILIKGYMAWYWNKVFSKDRYFLRKVNNYKMYLNLDDPGISTTLGRGSIREKEHILIIKSELKPGMTVLDIGANLGYYALMEASIVGCSGRVYAVEPVPGNYNLLIKNIKVNGYEKIVNAYQLAISDSIKKQRLYLSLFSNLNTLFPEKERLGSHLTGQYIEVDAVDIVSFIKDKPDIEFIRMDIEGAEIDVLKGLSIAVRKCSFRPKVLFECHFSKYAEKTSDMEEALNSLFDEGYFIKKLASNWDDGSKWGKRGYKPDSVIRTDGMNRGIYSNIERKDAVDLICHKGGVRAVLLEFKT